MEVAKERGDLEVVRWSWRWEGGGELEVVKGRGELVVAKGS